MSFNADVSKVTLSLYCEEENLEIEIIGKCGDSYNMAHTGTLEKGWNTISIDASLFGTASGAVDQIRMNLKTSAEVCLDIEYIAFAG